MDSRRFSPRLLIVCGGAITASLCAVIWAYVPSPPISVQEHTSAVPNAPVVFKSARDPHQTFRVYCVSCHGEQGNGNAPMAETMAVQPTHLAKGPYRYGRSLQDVATLIARGSGAMPGFLNEMSAEEIDALASYVLSLHNNSTESVK